MKRLDALAKVFRTAKPAVAVSFQLDRNRKRSVLCIVQQLLRGALSERRKRDQFANECIGCSFEVAISDTLRRDTPIVRLLARNATRAHDDILGPPDADHLLQTCRAARAGDLPEFLFGQRVKGRLRGDAEITGKRQLEADA